MGWDGHLLLLHRSESERLAGLAAWVRRGLHREEKVIYTEVPSDLPRSSLLLSLQAHGIDTTSAITAGHLAILRLCDYPPGGHVEVVERALAEGYRGVRMSAEVRAMVKAVTEPVYAGIERTTVRLCRTRPFSALCQYDQASTTNEGLRRITGAHMTGIRQEQLRTGPIEEGLALAGEVDVSNDDVFASVVRAAAAAAGRRLRLDLSRLTFLAAGGYRALVDSTQHFRDSGGRLLLMAPTPQVERILRMLAIDQLPHVELAARPS